MGDVIRFHRPSWPIIQGPVTLLGRSALRAQLEAGVQNALDLAEDLVDILDRIDAVAASENDENADHDLGSPKGPEKRVAPLRGNIPDGERPSPEQR